MPVFSPIRRVVIFGDSHAVEWQGTETTSPCNWRNYGAFHRANALLGSPLHIAGVKAFSGQTSAFILTKVATDVIPLGAEAVYLSAGANDPNNSLTPQQTIANVTAIYDALKTAGMVVFYNACMPRFGYDGQGNITYLTQAQVTHYTTVNTWAKEFERDNPGFVFLDTALAMLDTASLNAANRYSAVVGFMRDGTHENAVGAGIRARVIADKLLPLTGYGQSAFSANRMDDVGDLTCFSNNPLMALGTGGTLSGAGVFGVVPQGWTLSRVSGATNLTATGHYVNGVYTLTLANATSPSERISLRQDLTSRAPTVGKKYFVEGCFMPANNNGHFTALQVSGQGFGTGGFAFAANAHDNSGGAMALGNPAGVYRSRPFVIPAGGVVSTRTELIASASPGATQVLPIKSLGMREFALPAGA